jgi:hypothetical protein
MLIGAAATGSGMPAHATPELAVLQSLEGCDSGLEPGTDPTASVTATLASILTIGVDLGMSNNVLTNT